MNLADKVIGYFDPIAGARRLQARHAMESIEQKRRYNAAGRGRRTDDWKAGSQSVNRELEAGLQTIIARSRDLDRNNAYAKRAVDTIADNVVGIGVRPTFSRSVKKLESAWNTWAEKSTECDFDGRMNYYGLQWLTMRTVANSGSAFIRKRRTTKNIKSGIPIKLQVLEPDIVDTSKNLNNQDGGYSIQGIEFNKDGERVGYWMFERYPSESVGIKTSIQSKLVPADEVVHVYQVERPGQCHGLPFGIQGFMAMKDFDDYEDAELIRQKVAACYAIFIKQSLDSVTAATGGAKKGDVGERVEPGMISYLSPGDEVSFTNPPAKEGIAEYSKQVLRKISAAYGITYEVLTNDLSNVNFSSARMGDRTTARMYSRYQFQMFIPLFCVGTLNWFLEGAKIGMVYTKTDDITAEWTPPRRDLVDPQKEIAALSAEVRNGFKTWGEAVTELGYDPLQFLEQIEKWNKEFDDRGIILDSDPRRTAVGGKVQAPPAEDSADGEEPEEKTPAQAKKKVGK